ncbi:hypothetical protein J2T50_001765 [Streptococcus gallinaceus]|nr:hypothetical protein [Streptococcus gallinaceus]MCP1770824.1 hypothetical protein [Streptococcus gallinaceus]
MKKLVSVLFLFLSVLTIGLGITSNALASRSEVYHQDR